MKIIRFALIISLLISVKAYSQLSGIINQYSSVIAIINDCQTSGFQLSSTAGFNNGDLVLIHQAKGATLTNGNTATTGTLIAANDAGRYELNRIQSVTGNRIRFQFALKHTYSISGKIQVVKVVEGNTFQLSGNVFPQAWNGNTGGIVAIKARTINLNNFSVSADFAGFRGGRRSIDIYSPSLCGTNLYTTDSISGLSGERGESAGETLINERYGRAPLWFSGGGGNAVNASGGGGGLGGSGGKGGNEWIGCSNYQSNGGTGGTSLLSLVQNDTSRLFFGGAGGGGQVNNFGGSSGGNGGGIVLIIADTLFAGGVSSITSLGQSSQNSAGVSGDGTGGGGAGGTVFLNIKTVQGSLNINVRGGNSGNVSSNNGGLPCHGTGGGGGGGLLYLNLTAIPASLTFTAPGGIPGVNLTSNSNCNNTSFGAFPGSSGFVILNRKVIEAKLPYTLVQAMLIRGLPDSVRACLGQNVNLIGIVSPSTSVNWSGPNNFSSTSINLVIPSFSANQQGVYTVVADSSGCLDTVSVRIIPDLLPINIPTISPSCFGSSININIPFENGVQYNWQLPNGQNFNTNNLTGISNSNNLTGWWKLKRTSLLGCIIIDSVLAPAPISQDLIFGFPDTINKCLGSNINVNGQSLSGIIANWSGPAGFSATGNQWILNNFQLTNVGTYIGTASQSGCTDTVRIVLKTDLLPISMPNFPTNLCPGQPISISVINQNNVSFTWILPTGQTINGISINNLIYSNSLTGWWKLIALSQKGCLFSDSLFLPPNNSKVDSVLFNKEFSACQGDTINIPFAVPIGVSSEYWDIQNNGYLSFINPLIINGISFSISPQRIFLRFTHLGCSRLDTIIITESDSCEQADLFIPNVFTPNGDDKNPNFTAFGRKPIFFRLKVFNRWGQQIYETTDFDIGWNGEVNGFKCNEGIYVYLIDYQLNSKSAAITRSGMFSLLR